MPIHNILLVVQNFFDCDYPTALKIVADLMSSRLAQFQHAMEHRFIEVVQRLSGRPVLTFISNSHVGPDLEIELFVLGPADAADRR